MKRPLYISPHAAEYTSEAQSTALDNLSSYWEVLRDREMAIGIGLFILTLLLFV